MYTTLKNVQILVSLLKQHNIRHLVLSPGTRNTPLGHSVETDSFFKCYSIVDERSAAYFAIGLAKSLNKPVAVSCTSSTATCNYMPAVEEAWREHLPLLLLTSDREEKYLYQMEDQMINQVNMYRQYCKKAVDIPIINSKDDIWYAERSINEALLDSIEKPFAPVQINYRINNLGKFDCKTLPKARKINRVNIDEFKQKKETYINELKNKKRILVICGMNYKDNLDKELKKFQEKYNSIVSADYLSNLHSDFYIKTVVLTECMDQMEFKKYMPDLIITVGGHIWSFIKYKLRNSNYVPHWHISKTGEVNDGFKSLEVVFKMDAETFFKEINVVDNYSDNTYKKIWIDRTNKLKYPKKVFSNFFAIQSLCKNIPSNSLIHLSILNSIRLTNFNKIDVTNQVYANIGADGIDGCLSTYIGETLTFDKLSFLIIGDLSFLYDLNAIKYLKNPNQRIFLINNFSGAEFHNNFGLSYIPTLNEYIAAGHETIIKNTVNLSDINYLSANDFETLDSALKKFISPSEKPIILEVFTNADTDSKVLKEFYKINQSNSILSNGKKVIKKILRR